MPKDAALLEEIQDRWKYATNEWAPIRKEAKTDMLVLAGQAWQALDPAGAKQREDAKRPMIAVDELHQYVNQGVNDLRQNKRGIKVTPVGNGANDHTASFRQGKIRDIEYRSNASQAYTTMAQDMFQRGYGFLRIKSKYVSDRSFDQELVIEPIVNPDLVTPDPDFLRADGSDWKYLFLEEARTKKEFARDFPDATVKTFNSDTEKFANGWISGDSIRIAEYWAKMPGKKRRLLQLKPHAPTPQEPQPQPTLVYEDELHQRPSSEQILNDRMVMETKVCQYLTNGIEILEENPWPGSSIPFVMGLGMVMYADAGAGVKRYILSLIRLAREPQMLLNYIRSCEAEAIGAVPRNAWIGYKGQFADPAEWQKANHVPVAFLEAEPTVEGTQQGQVLPLPQRQPWDPPLQNLEIAAESARRAIQSAVGVSPLPTQAQRRNEKSGVALKQIEDTSQKGSFHFTDHYDQAVTRVGAILDDVLPHYYDTARETSIRKPDDSVELVRINDQAGSEANGQPHYPTDVGDHDVTISVGPALESERDAASQFADTIVTNHDIAAVIGPQKTAELISLAIKLKNVGPIGDQMAEIIAPKQDQDPKQAQQQLQQAGQLIQELQGKLQQATQMLQTDAIKQQAVIHKANIDADKELALQAMKDATSIAVAHIGANAKGAALDAHAAEEGQALGHDLASTVVTHQHERDMAQMQHQHALQQGAQQGAQDAALSDQGHQQALEQGDQGIAGQMAVQDNAPQPEAGA